MNGPFLGNRAVTGTVTVFPVRRIFGLYTIYGGGVLLTAILLNLVARSGFGSDFQESGIVEWLQAALLVSSMAVFFHCRHVFAGLPNIPEFLAGVYAVALVREHDAPLDQFMPAYGWQLFATLLIGALILSAWRRRGPLREELGVWLRSRAFAFFWFGICVVIFAQIIGNGGMLQSLLGDAYVYLHTRVIEESFELLGYLLLLYSSVETWLASRNPTRCYRI